MSKLVGGTIVNPGLQPVVDAEITVEVNAPVNRVIDESSIARHVLVKSAFDGTWSLDLEANDFLTPSGSSYKIHEKYPEGDYKVYYIRVLSTLPGGLNQVLDLLTTNPPQIGEDVAVIQDGVNGTIIATVKSLTNSKPLMVAIADANGDQITSFGGGTQYTEDAVAAADPVGTAINLVRKDTPAATVSADGDNITLRGGNFGNAYVTLVDNSGNFVSVGGGTQYTEDAVAVADPIGTMQVARRRDTPAAETSTDGDIIALNATNKGEQYVKHIDPIPITDNAGSITVDNATLEGAVRAEDAASADGHTGIGALAVRKATPADTSGADGDYEFLQMKSGRLWASATIDAALPTGGNTIGSVNLTAGTNTNEMVGDVAEDAALAGNPVREGVRAHSGIPTAMSADNDIVTPWADRSGALVVIPQPRILAPIVVTPTIATSGYVNGDQVGGLMTFTSAALATGRATQVVQARITSRTATALNALNLWLFEVSPTITSSDNAPLDISGANLETASPLGVVKFFAADYVDTANSCMCFGTLNQGPITMFGVPSASANLFGVLEMAGTPAAQYAGTSDIKVALWVNPV